MTELVVIFLGARCAMGCVVAADDIRSRQRCCQTAAGSTAKQCQAADMVFSPPEAGDIHSRTFIVYDLAVHDFTEHKLCKAQNGDVASDDI